MKLKKILAGVLAGAMVLGSVATVSATAADSTTASLTGADEWWGATTSTAVDFPADGETLVIEFTVTDEGAWDGGGVLLLEARDNDATTYLDVPLYGGGPWGAYIETTNSYSDTHWDDGTYEGQLYAGHSYTVTVTVDGLNVVFVMTDDTDGVTQATFDIDVTELPDIIYLYAMSGTYEITYTTAGIYAADMTVLVGENNAKALTIDLKPSSLTGLTYSSSNEEIATVDENGIVTGVADGEAIITITNGTYTDTCTVTVTSTENPIASVDAKASATELTVGSSATITADYTATDTATDTTDDTTVYYESSNTDVLTVTDSGVVTAVAAGTATVTVTIGSASATIEFTVTEAAAEDDTDDTEESTSNVATGTETLECGSFWSIFSQAFELSEEPLVITVTTTSLGSSNWENLIYVVYTSADSLVYDAGTDGYTEYWVGRADNYGWGDGEITETSVGDDFDWDAWLAATQEGATVTITAYLDGDNAIVTLECEGVVYTATIPVDTSAPVYLALSGENCVLSDLTVNGEATLFGAVESDDDDTSDDVDTGDDESGSSAPKTADTTPILPIAAAFAGCAIIAVVARKKVVK